MKENCIFGDVRLIELLLIPMRAYPNIQKLKITSIHIIETMKKILSFATIVAILFSCNQGNNLPKSQSSDTPSAELITEVLTKAKQQELTPNAVLIGLQEGNERYVNNQRLKRDLNAQSVASLEGQHPEAIILSCIDSRVPVEYIFDKGIGDLFVGRVAGNVADKHMLGSMEYACGVSGAKVILVLGHQDCGAVKAAIKGVEMGNITSLMEDIKPSVEQTQYTGERVYSNDEFARAVIDENVLQTIEEIKQNSPILKQLEEEGKINICGAVYEMATGRVRFL